MSSVSGNHVYCKIGACREVCCNVLQCVAVHCQDFGIVLVVRGVACRV